VLESDKTDDVRRFARSLMHLEGLLNFLKSFASLKECKRFLDDERDEFFE
jgi:hypothetical protein